MRWIFALVLVPSPALAQDIIVTGQGLRQAPGDAAYDRIVIGRERLTGSASGRLDEILKDVPGFQLFRRSDARSANPTSQGATLRALGGNASSRALLLLDGVPQADPFGGWVSWPAYDPARLGSVRVTRGGGGGANGPGALAGTIELSSASPADIDGIGGDVAFGSRDSFDARAGLGVRLGEGFVTGSASVAQGDGFVPIVAGRRGPVDRPSPYRQTSLAVRGVAPIDPDTELQASGLWFSDARERGTAFSSIRTTGADASLRLVGERWQALGYVQTRDFYNSFAAISADRTSVARASEQYNVPSTGLGVRGEFRPTLGAVELRLGGDWRLTDGETRERFNFQNGVGTRGRVAGGRTTTLGGFAEAALERGPLTITGSGRIDRWWIDDGILSERVFATGQVLADTRFPDRAGWEPTGRIGAAYRPVGAIMLRAAGYLGWRLPTLNELYRPFRAGADATAANAALAPERLKGIEAGIEYRPRSTARAGITVFANRLGDAIANVTLGRGPGVFPGVGFVAAGGEYRQRRNLPGIGVRGIEADASLQIGAWSLSGCYAFADAKVRAKGLALDGRRPAQTPRHSFAATLAWRDTASLTARYVGRQFEDDLNEQALPGALTFDATAAIPIARRITLEARAENALNARVVAAISGGGIVERATPRTLWLGLKLRAGK